MQILLKKKVAILAADGFEQAELEEPKKALEAAGATTQIVSPASKKIRGMNHDEKADFFAAGKPVAAICHAPWVLIDAKLVEGRTLTSWPAIKTDAENAGGHWVDEEVVVDRGLVSSRKRDDIPAFNKKMIEEFSKTEYTG